MIVTDLQKDAIRELINIAVGRAAGMLNTLIDKHLTLFVPSEIDIENHYLREETLACVSMNFKNAISGNCKMIFPWSDAEKLVNLFTNDNLISDNFEEVRAAVLSEVGNIVLNSLMGTISNLVNSSFIYQVPNYTEGHFDVIFDFNNLDENSFVLIAKTQFKIDDLEIFGDLMIFLQLDYLEIFLNKVDFFAEHFGQH